MEDQEECAAQEIAEPDSCCTYLIDTLHAAHVDNPKLRYFAHGPRNRQISQMPSTPFIYEFSF